MATGTRKILIVEDDSNTAEVIRSFIELRGYEAAICANGTEALRRIDQVDYDAFLVDFNMPGMSGPELVMHLRRKFPQAIIVGISGFDMAELFLSAGADHFIQKPFKMETFEQLLRAIHPTAS